MASGDIKIRLPLVVIAGPTASGKTKLAIELARELDGEIICADSRTIYKEMDIGTAKPTPEERSLVPHWGLDLVEPGDSYTAADFQHYAHTKIEEIRSRNRIPFLVGGTGLYIDSVIFDYQFGPPANDELRARLSELSLEDLYVYCEKNNIILPENKLNKRYVIRAIEQKNINNKRRNDPIENSIVVGISTNRMILRNRIEARTEQIFASGVIQEGISLGEKYGWDCEAMTGNIYPLIRAYTENLLSYEGMKAKFTIRDWQLAKRQLTWLRRNSAIKWLSLEDAKQYVLDELARRK